MAESKQATPAEAAALQGVYAKLSDLLTTLRLARGHIHHPELLAMINGEIDRLLAADDALRQAIVDFTGQPVSSNPSY
jgi:hypothetical protein